MTFQQSLGSTLSCHARILRAVWSVALGNSPLGQLSLGLRKCNPEADRRIPGTTRRHGSARSGPILRLGKCNSMQRFRTADARHSPLPTITRTSDFVAISNCCGDHKLSSTTMVTHPPRNTRGGGYCPQMGGSQLYGARRSPLCPPFDNLF